MNCAESHLLLQAQADDEIDVGSILALDAHLKTCAACSAEKKSLHSLKAALRGAPLTYDAPDSLRKEVSRMARASAGESASRVPFLLVWKWLAFGATAVAMLAIVLRPAGISSHEVFLSEALASHVRSLMVEHLTDVASSDQHTVKPWFDGKLDFAPDVKDFTAQGFPLVGGRLDYLNGRAVAALVYRSNKHLINVFVWPIANAATGKLTVESRRGYSVINRAANGMHYCLVSDLNEKELLELADLLIKP